MKYNFPGLEPKEEISKQSLLYNDKKERAMHKRLDLRNMFLIHNEWIWVYSSTQTWFKIYKIDKTFEDTKKWQRNVRKQEIVREPDQNNWLKMVHLFKYTRGIKYLME